MVMEPVFDLIEAQPDRTRHHVLPALPVPNKHQPGPAQWELLEGLLPWRGLAADSRCAPNARVPRVLALGPRTRVTGGTKKPWNGYGPGPTWGDVDPNRR
jgi:hypothetical protein